MGTHKLFKGDLDFVSKIYFMLLRENHHLDYSSDYLVHFLSLDDSNIQKYSKFLFLIIIMILVMLVYKYNLYGIRKII